MNELKLFTWNTSGGPEWRPGIPAFDLPRRSMIVHSPTHITSVDMYNQSSYLRLIL